MKFKFKPAIIFTTLMIGAIGSLSGCATTGMDLAASAPVDVSRASLDDLVKPVQPEMNQGGIKKISAAGCALKQGTKDLNGDKQNYGVKNSGCTGNQI